MQKTTKLLTIGITAIVFLWTLAMMPAPSFAYILIDDTDGGDCTTIGSWDSNTKTCTLTGDVDATIQINSDGITLDGDGHTVTWSSTASGYNGVYLQGRTNVTIRNLNVETFTYGIYLGSSSTNTLTNNNVSDNSFLGIYLDDSDNNTLSGNTALNNYIGIYLVSSSDNKIYHNNFIGNSYQHAYDILGTDNTWDDGNSGGNYWSDYTDPDSDGDGIGNIPYVIAGDSGSQDNYPFMTESGWPTTPNEQPVVIDIKPGSDPNSINPGSKGVVPVAILTTGEFDASDVDASTVRFGPDEAEAVHYALEDVDGDGNDDMILHFKTQETGIAEDDTSATLLGYTVNDWYFEASDSVRTVPPKGKKGKP